MGSKLEDFNEVKNMRTARGFRQLIVALSCVGLLGGQAARAAHPLGVPMRDVALQAGGVLQGQVLDEQGAALPHTRVALTKQGEAVALTQTDAEGRFAVHGVAAGIYELQTAQSAAACRLWAPNTAPPAAQPSVLLISDDSVVRGQFGPGMGWGSGGGLMGWLTNPWVLAGIVAAAIAIPIAVSDDDAS